MDKKCPDDIPEVRGHIKRILAPRIAERTVERGGWWWFTSYPPSDRRDFRKKTLPNGASFWWQ